ncbi:response regulator [Acidisoma silvae]|uniref:Response regulator n=1 Tax=Acidisoma silvae TaxID=2802396 RepID=A0A964E187_9PROT|nr:response regulator [Acidisoma silvae]MCB8877967.1 response regulator [Acidisoma silvae]
MASSKYTILVVEDDPLLRLTAADMVEGAGFECLEAGGADEALSILEERSDIRIVFSDIDMPPGADGITLAAEIKERWPQIAIVLTSGHYKPPEIAMPHGGMFFPKPIKENEVISAFKKLSARPLDA